MQVKDLIAKLQEMPQDAVVLVNNEGMETSGDKPASYVNLSEEGSKTKVQTRDAFDGGTYSYERWSTVGGEEKVIKIW